MAEKGIYHIEVASENTGLVYVFTGDGKGKTSAALWTVMRAALSGKNVAIIHWYKEARWPTNDQKIQDLLPNLQDFLMGQGFYKLRTDHASQDEHRLAAKAALAKAIDLLPEVDVLVLDEIVNAIADGLLEESEVLNMLAKRGPVHLILTGRGASDTLIDQADLVTEMKKVKHPFDKGRKAINGLDF